MTGWVPLRRKDFSFSPMIDIIGFIRHRVVNYNESYDILVKGPKGIGKSTCALAFCMRYNSGFDIQKHVSFSAQEWLEKARSGNRGDIMMCDEMGTRQFGSSHKWQREDNQELADIVQLNRTDGIAMIGTTLDAMRVTNRVRDTYAVHLDAEEKVKVPFYEVNEDGKRVIAGHYLAIRCLIRFRKPDIFNQNSGMDYLVYPRNGPNCVIKRVLLFHPPLDVFDEYSRHRDELKTSIINSQHERITKQLLKEQRREGPNKNAMINDQILTALFKGRGPKI